MSRTCFNGLCRFNRSGEFNVPFGQYRTVSYATDFGAYQKSFRRWKFTNQDLEKLPIEPQDFIYADPPYDVEFTTYSAGGFSWDQATARIVNLYRREGSHLRFLNAPRRISSDGNREAAREVLAGSKPVFASEKIKG